MRKIRSKYEGPRHPWEKGRIEEEKAIVREYGLKNKTEIWKLDSERKRATSQAKKLIALAGAQSELEKNQLIARLQKLGVLHEGADLDDVLGLTLKDFLERRLQTIVFRKGLARSVWQARQFITHGHIQVNGKTVTAPGYLVLKAEEENISFSPSSPLANSEHPERQSVQAKPVEKPVEQVAEAEGA